MRNRCLRRATAEKREHAELTALSVTFTSSEANVASVGYDLQYVAVSIGFFSIGMCLA
jgi:hypothetical protein